MKVFDLFFLVIQRALPKKLLTKIFGKVASCEGWPAYLLKHTFKFIYKINMGEATYKALNLYSDLNALFTRRLDPQCRPQPIDSSVFSSPADGKLTQLGKIENHSLIQAKGIEYTLTSLMASDPEFVKPFEQGGNFSCIYLAPHNYHRVHMPFDGELENARYIPGELFSVNKRTTTGIQNLYCKNERVVLLFRNKKQYFSVILVGAFLVGGLAVILPSRQGGTQTYVPGLQWTSKFEPDVTSEISRGSEIGYFYFGSTVILLTSRDGPDWLPSLEKDILVRVGDPLTGPAASR